MTRARIRFPRLSPCRSFFLYVYPPALSLFFFRTEHLGELLIVDPSPPTYIALSVLSVELRKLCNTRSIRAFLVPLSFLIFLLWISRFAPCQPPVLFPLPRALPFFRTLFRECQQTCQQTLRVSERDGHREREGWIERERERDST